MRRDHCNSFMKIRLFTIYWNYTFQNNAHLCDLFSLPYSIVLALCCLARLLNLYTIFQKCFILYYCLTLLSLGVKTMNALFSLEEFIIPKTLYWLLSPNIYLEWSWNYYITFQREAGGKNIVTVNVHSPLITQNETYKRKHLNPNPSYPAKPEWHSSFQDVTKFSV